MREFAGRVAVITGACGSLGVALAHRCLQEQMKVVLADADGANLERLQRQLVGQAPVLAVRTEVGQQDQVENLARQTMDAFGQVHLLLNTVQLEAGGSAWETSWEDWDRVLRVNLWGCIQLVKVFTPLMLEHKGPGHIVNVSSACGLLCDHPSAPYQVSQSALIALSENLSVSLQMKRSALGVSVLCVGPHDSCQQDLVNTLFEGIGEEKFYLFPDPHLKPRLSQRLEQILQQMSCQ